MWHPIRKAFDAAVVLTGHLFISVVMVGVIFVVDWLFDRAFGERQPLIWGILPFKYLFQAPEGCSMIVFTIWGIINRVMKG